MPKYSVSEVLEIIKSLTAEEKRKLQQHLPHVLDTEAIPSGRDQSQSMSGINISGSSGVDMSQIQADEASSVIPSKTQAKIQNTDLQAVLGLLKKLKFEVTESRLLNLVEKKTVEVPIETLETELKKPKPDKSLINRSVEALKKGLASVEALADPVIRIADLIAKLGMGI